jgi:iron complex outermembrane receptor protein
VNTVGVYLGIKERDFIQELNFTSRQLGRLTMSAGLFFLDKVERYAPNGTLLYPGVASGGAPTTAYPATDAVGLLGTASKAAKQSYAAYIELNYKLTDQLDLTLAGRYSHERSKVFSANLPFTWVPGDPEPTPLPDPRAAFTFDKFTPRAVLRFKPNENHTLYASYSQGFKSGYVNPGNLLCTPSPQCIDPPVKPEVVDAFEVGYKGKIGGILDLTLAGFHYIYKDIQVFIYNPPPGISSYQNAAKGKINGVELSASLRPTPELTLNASGSYLDAKYSSFPTATVFNPNGFGNTQTTADASGKQLMRTPKWTLNGSIDYTKKLAPGELGAYVGVSYSSGIYFDPINRVRQPRYALVDAELSFAPQAFDGMRLVLWGKNLTNKAYLQSVLESTISDTASFADPRTYGVRVEYRF